MSKAFTIHGELLVTGARTLYESKAFIIHAEFHGTV